MNTNFQTIHQMGSAISDFVKQATGRDSVQNIDMDHVTVAQNHVYEEVDISGQAVRFNAGAAGLAFEKLLVQIKPVQDLHGYDHPWPPGGGKNLLDPSLLKNQGAWNIIVLTLEPNTVYTCSCDIDNGTGLYVYFRDIYGAGGPNTTQVYSDRPITLTSTSDGHLWLSQRIAYGTETFASHKIQVEKGSTATSFAPYSNICPITGWTMVNLYRAGQNLEDAQVFRFPFPSEAGVVYGGTLDAVTGELVVDKYLYVYDGTEAFSKSTTALNGFYNILVGGSPHSYWPRMLHYQTSQTPITDECSSMFIPTVTLNVYRNNYGYVYFDSGQNFNADPEIFGTTVDSFKQKLAEFYAAGTPVSVFCKIGTPITYQLTPQEITTLLGQNNIWADTGDIEVKFTNLKELY